MQASGSDIDVDVDVGDTNDNVAVQSQVKNTFLIVSGHLWKDNIHDNEYFRNVYQFADCVWKLSSRY